jgi:hypothetical protein
MLSDRLQRMMCSHAAVPHLLADANGRQGREGTDLLQSFGDKSLKISAKLLRPVRPRGAKAFRVYEPLHFARGDD